MHALRTRRSRVLVIATLVGLALSACGRPTPTTGEPRVATVVPAATARPSAARPPSIAASPSPAPSPAVEIGRPLPDDPRLAEQWYLGRIGAPAAWAAARAAEPVTVAVLDSGAALDHPDLAGRIVGAVNVREPGEEPADRAGHGTAVAGVIAAEHGNGRGIAGVAPNARLLVVKVAEDGVRARPRDLARGLIAAVDRGARVVNLSVAADPVEAVREAVAHAIRHDVLLVAAAGNGGAVGSYFSDPFPEMLVVGSTDREDRPAGFSNHGPGVDLAAPGVAILTLTIPRGYGPGEYTSISAPQVAGAAALLRGVHPEWSAAQVGEQLCATADRTAGTGADWRCGRLNLARAAGR